MMVGGPIYQLSAAAARCGRNLRLLQRAGSLRWISIRGWDSIHQTNALGSYDRCMAYTAQLEDSIHKVRESSDGPRTGKKIRRLRQSGRLQG